MLLAAGIGLVASRAGFVALSWPAYAQSLAGGASPGGWIETLLQIVQIREGGWLPEAGLAAAVGVLLAGGWRYPLTRRPLALGASARPLPRVPLRRNRDMRAIRLLSPPPWTPTASAGPITVTMLSPVCPALAAARGRLH